MTLLVRRVDCDRLVEDVEEGHDDGGMGDEVLLNHQNYTDNLTHSPYFSGIILGSMFWIGYSWFTRLVQGTSEVRGQTSARSDMNSVL